jgi:D-galactarolactone cycloisomerase
MKLKIGFGIETAPHYMRAAREAICYDIKLMANCNCCYNQANARRLLYGLNDVKIEFLEEPVPPEDIDGYTALRNLNATHLAVGKNLVGKQNFKHWFESGVLDIYQPDLCSSGGFAECKKIAVLTKSYNTALIPHMWGSGGGLTSPLQFISTRAPVPLCGEPFDAMVEYDQSSHPFRLDLIDGTGIESKDRHLIVPGGLGIGVGINRKILGKYKIN